MSENKAEMILFVSPIPNKYLKEKILYIHAKHMSNIALTPQPVFIVWPL